MRRRLLNQAAGDPAQGAIDAYAAARLGDIARLPRIFPTIVTPRERERVTEVVKENDGAGAQGRSGLSSRAGALPPSPPAPRPILRLKQ